MMPWVNQSQQTTKYIGIDPGVNTGIAIWNKSDKKLELVKTVKIHIAMQMVMEEFKHNPKIIVRVEDARQRTWFGKAGREQLQGAGSIKRDCSVWEDYLKDHNIQHEMVAPKNNKTKVKPEYFVALTKYTGLTSVHSRDAALMVYGL